MGKPRDALIAVGESVALFRGLAEHEPDRYLPGLAGSLLTQGEFLWVLDRPQEALGPIQESVTAFRRLASQDPPGTSRSSLIPCSISASCCRRTTRWSMP